MNKDKKNIKERNIFLEVEYVGTRYFGFQIQDKNDRDEITVQQVLESALEKLFCKKIRIVYASRTDRGVHAKSQGVNFKTDTFIPLKNIKEALNSYLPEDVRIKRVKAATLDFHARFWAKSKIYRYIILNAQEPSVFWNDFSWYRASLLNLEYMRKASRQLLGKRDFGLFAKGARNYKNCRRELKSITIKKRNNRIYNDIEPDGFLRNMARNIVSLLVKIGEGKIDSQSVFHILERKIPYTNKPAPACGLYLSKIKYH
ncbi:MAG: tRNA pseudouridine(38-40) synthase TruA [Candidatus Omnitrophota bacterium]|nr:MAG: tRNA pseudouridine(38-40) synthase TruA [Candidatus Omnitrophota bacterium]